MPSNCKKWSKEEEDFIRDNYTELSDDEIGKTPEGKEIDHIDCNKTNNALYNLEFVSHQENMKRAVAKNCFSHLFGR